MPERVVDLAAEHDRIQALWLGDQDNFVPLAVAAALAFQGLRGNDLETVPLAGYWSDLDLVAAALSRHCRIHSKLADHEDLTPLPVNLRNQRFANGATELHSIEDGFFFDQLSILRTDVMPAIALMKRAGLSLTCQNVPVARNRHLHSGE